MTWFKLDDKVAFGTKVMFAGNEAFGAWCRAGAWSSGELQDGFVPHEIANLMAPKRVWKKLVAARLLHEAEGGWQIHDFLDWNPSAEEVRSKRAVRAAAGSLGGKRSGTSRANAKQMLHTGEANDEANASRLLHPKSNPVPSRPVPSPAEPPESPPLGPPSDQSRRRAAEADGLFDGTPEMFRRAMATATGNPQDTLSTWERKDLAGLIATHANGLEGDALENWMAVAAHEYCAVGRARFGCKPRHLSNWMSAGRPTADAPKSSAPRRAVQGGPLAGPANTQPLHLDDEQEDHHATGT